MQKFYIWYTLYCGFICLIEDQDITFYIFWKSSKTGNLYISKATWNIATLHNNAKCCCILFVKCLYLLEISLQSFLYSLWTLGCFFKIIPCHDAWTENFNLHLVWFCAWSIISGHWQKKLRNPIRNWPKVMNGLWVCKAHLSAKTKLKQTLA